MSRPYLTARHIESMALLPENLEIGRAYFVDDEQVIVIDHGRGPVIYGNSPGPQGIAGEPIPQLQDQIDLLAEASLKLSSTIWEINEREIERHSHIQETISDIHAQITAALAAQRQELLDAIQTQRDEIDAVMQEQAERVDSALNILAKSIANLYPEQFAPEDSQDDTLDNETVSTPAGSWTIQQTTLKDGTVVLNLEAQELVIDSIKVGDSVDFDGSTWTVEDVSTTDGVTSITIRP